MYMNSHEYSHDFIQFHLKLFELFQIGTNFYKCIFNLFENMHTAALQHTAALPDSRTQPRVLPDSCTLLQALPHSRIHMRTLPQTAVLPHTA
jgi:hypothetical protein